MLQSENAMKEDSADPNKTIKGANVNLPGCDISSEGAFTEVVRNVYQQQESSKRVVENKIVRPASLPVKKCFDHIANDGGFSGELNAGAPSTEIDSTAALCNPNEGSFWKRYADVSVLRKDTCVTADSPAASRRRSDTSFLLVKKRFSSFNIGGQEANIETMDDDLAPLLPSKRELSQDDIYQSEASLVSSSDGGVLAEGEETSSESQVSDNSRGPPCVLGLVERLLRTHPVWFLPGIQRSGAVHLLQGKEEGNFIVRGSSQSKTMAVSVRLPQETGPYIEHYLIQSNDGQLSLESSRFKFDSIPSLIAHYSQCCDELPVQLCLPKPLREAKNRQQLSSLALLGQEFWRYPMAVPKPKTSVLSPISSHLNTPSDITQSSGIGLTFQNRKLSHLTHFGQEGNIGPEETPTDTISTMSSFTIGNCQQLLSPESIDSAVIVSPTDANQTGIVGKTSTFKSKAPLQSPLVAVYDVEKQIDILNANLFDNNDDFDLKIGDEIACSNALERQLKTPRPTPPNTLNLKPMRSPPAPPTRRLKLPTIANTPTDSSSTFPSNITVTTTVTFSVDNHTNPHMIELLSPAENSKNLSSFQSSSARLPPDGECNIANSLSKPAANGVERVSEPELLSPLDSRSQNQLSFRKHLKYDYTSSVAHTNRTSRRSKRKESKHYQESDILESPSVYCRSNLGDKISDYEDIWTQDSNGNTSLVKVDNVSTFKPLLVDKSSTVQSPVAQTFISSSREMSKSSEMTAFSTESVQLRQHHHSDASSERNTPTEPYRNVLKTFFPSLASDKSPVNPMLEPRYRMGLCIPNTANRDTRTETSTPVSMSTTLYKQESPFYADPADILSGIVRRSPFNRSNVHTSQQRHSEPPKQLNSDVDINSPLLWASVDHETKKMSAASLDESKNFTNDQGIDIIPRFDRMSLEQTEANDYDNDLRWMANHAKSEQLLTQRNVKIISPCQEMDKNAVTVHQIIAKRLPHLDLPELYLRVNDYGPSRSNVVEADPGTLGRTQRKSAYDNVEKHGAAYASSLVNSSQSDDGTVFSEPWDSSQWEGFLPQEGNTNSALMSNAHTSNMEDKCVSSGEFASHSMSLRRDATTKKSNPSQKIATILRSRSCRDREILCHPRNKAIFSGPGESIGSYALLLADDTESTFSRNISNFISCTKESKAAPQVVMRNMRQFMSGMKNYLVKHGEGEFASEVQKARAHLKSDEFLNLDSILEEVMHRLVILPLREHLYGLFVDYYTQSGDIQMLVEKVKHASGRGPTVFGIKNSVIPPSPNALRKISALFVRLQETQLPLEKLDLLLMAVSAIFESTANFNGQQLSADDFLPVLVLVVAHCGFIGAEIEAEYMWGLIQPSLLSGEAGYYLTALCSAVHVLKNFSLQEQESFSGSTEWSSNVLPECSSVLRVIIPDEYNGSIQTRTLPIRPHTTTKEVCRIIAHKARITNAQDYGLFKLIDGEETLLQDNECPQDVRMAACGKHCMIAYKRVDAKIAWPTVMPATSTENQFHNE